MHANKPLIPRLVLGTAQWGMPYGITNDLHVPSGQDVRSMLKEAQGAGCLWVDSAFSYGDALEKISNSRVSGLNLTLKFHLRDFLDGDSYQSLESRIMAKLERLVGSFDVFPMFHDEAEAQTADGQRIRHALLNLREKGLIGEVGLSTYEVSHFRKSVEEYRPLQVNTNVLHPNLVELTSLDRDLGPGQMHIRSVFLQGLLLRQSSGLALKFQEFRPVLERFWGWVDSLGISDIEGALSVVNQLPNSYFVLGLASQEQLTEALNHLNSGRIPMEGPDLVAPVKMIDPRIWPAK